MIISFLLRCCSFGSESVYFAVILMLFQKFFDFLHATIIPMIWSILIHGQDYQKNSEYDQ